MIRSDHWVKSSRSSGNGGACVEMRAAPGRILVRDSKDPNGGALSVSRPAWREFIDSVKA
jgi:hypothetical protein